MTAPGPKAVRCAIYTRKSSEEGLDQAFNTLHAQREACEAYVKSQASEGWRVLATPYDDGGYSGGTLERPALRQLLADVDAGRVDTIVVYKIDRLTRSLADFAKIVERLDLAKASFVSVTQAFNTTTSMGRLTLNVLLSFAQFEREVTGERIRDKIAASKAKGMWMGGQLPLGYDDPTDPLTRALVVNEPEAQQVRLIFQKYLDLGSVAALEAWLAEQSITSKSWVSKGGRAMGGHRFSRGALFHLLKNRVYLGEIPHRDLSYPGAHPPIIQPELFAAVQGRLVSQARAHHTRPTKCAAMPLRGRVFDADGNPMSPSFGYGARGKIYRYYVSSPLLKGRELGRNDRAIRRIAADALEELLGRQLAEWLGVAEPNLLAIKRVDLEAELVQLSLLRSDVLPSLRPRLEPHASDAKLGVITLAIQCRVRGGRTTLTHAPGSGAMVHVKKDPGLIRGLAAAHAIAAKLGWRSSDGRVDQLEANAPASTYDRKRCRLAFLAPDIQAAILAGTQPASLTLDRLLHQPIPMAWPEQRRLLGFP